MYEAALSLSRHLGELNPNRGDKDRNAEIQAGSAPTTAAVAMTSTCPSDAPLQPLCGRLERSRTGTGPRRCCYWAQSLWSCGGDRGTSTVSTLTPWQPRGKPPQRPVLRIDP
jgi:hypothetical protein